VIVEDDPELRAEMLGRIKSKFNLFNSKREGLHHSDLTYCITKTYWKGNIGSKPTDHEALLFAVGLALEQVILEDFDSNHRPPSVQVDGVWLSPDHVTLLSKGLTELKSSRISIPKNELNPKNGWPEGWIKQMKGYKYAELTGAFKDIVEPSDYYRIAAYLVIPAELHGRKFIFTSDELTEHWASIMENKWYLEQAQEQGVPPEPYAFVSSRKHDDWQCRNCSFQMHCSATYSAGTFVRRTT
jgi:hypothetical protein